MAKPLLENKEARDKFAQQAGYKDYNDLADQYGKDPNSWTANKGKIYGDESYTPEQIQNYIEQDIMNRKGNKSAPAPSSDYNKAVVENYSQEELAGKKGFDDVTNSTFQAGNVAEINPLDAAIGRIKAGEASDEDLKLAFESGYVGGPNTQEAYKKLGLGVEDVADTVEEASVVAQPVKSDTLEEKAAKNDYKKSTKSIWDAYYNGDIDKTTATYFTLDAIATLSKNLGREIGNVGAQFTGGTIDNNMDTSKWDQRQNELFNEEIQKEKESLGGPAGRQARSEELGLTSQEIQNEVARVRANYTDEQIQQQIAMMDKQLEQMGLNIENMEDARTFVETLKQKPESERTWLDNLMIAWMSQSGVNSAINTGSSGISSLIGLLAK